jgi:hypothetical protein
MKAIKLYRFDTYGRGAFPFDMLRYDSCYPAGVISSGNLVVEDQDEMRTVSLYSTRKPTVARWNSFGWGCDIAEEIR